jgi:hypothetical protein
VEDRVLQGRDAFGHSHVIAFGRQPAERGVEDSNTARCAADPVAPELGGKLKMVMAMRRSARAARRRAISLATLPASAAARSGSPRMAWIGPVISFFGVDGAALRPPNTLGQIAPSSSGRATIIVASSGTSPVRRARHSSIVWNSTAWAAM